MSASSCDGQKLKGEFSLIRLAKGKENNWLLVKKDDEFVRPDSKFDDRSVQTGRNLEHIAAGAIAKNGVKIKKTGRRAGQANHASRRTFVRPMLATPIDKPFDRDGWFFEVKWDGFRAIAELNDGQVRLYSRNQQSFNETFAPIAECSKTSAAMRYSTARS